MNSTWYGDGVNYAVLSSMDVSICVNLCHDLYVAQWYGDCMISAVHSFMEMPWIPRWTARFTIVPFVLRGHSAYHSIVDWINFIDCTMCYGVEVSSMAQYIVEWWLQKWPHIMSVQIHVKSLAMIRRLLRPTVLFFRAGGDCWVFCGVNMHQGGDKSHLGASIIKSLEFTFTLFI